MVRVVDYHPGILGLNPGGPKDFPFGIALMVSEVFDELMQSNLVTPLRVRAVAGYTPLYVCRKG